ncbi:MAG: SCO family protein [Burkholderiales bacterium]|nr:SCO family protein [Burkholderiales bacterium]
MRFALLRFLVALLPLPIHLRRLAGWTRWLLRAAVACAAAPVLAQPLVLQGVTGTDQHGRAFEARQLAGRPLLMHFVYTGCGTTCPTQVAELAALHAELPEAARRKLQFLSVSVDPLADTPAALAAFARRMGADRPGWRFVTGRPQALEPLYQRMQVFDPRAAAPGVADHRTSLYLYAADGRLLQRFRGVPVDRARLLAELSRL